MHKRKNDNYSLNSVPSEIYIAADTPRRFNDRNVSFYYLYLPQDYSSQVYL